MTASPTPSAVQTAIARSAAIAELVIGTNVLATVPDLLRRNFDAPAKAVLVSDGNTWQVAGRHVSAALTGAGVAVRDVRFPASPRPHATVAGTQPIAAALAETGGIPVVVGSGVLNDLTKYAAHKAGLPYLCVATAASMDGYASAGAPLSDAGFKHTIQCVPPRVMVADLGVVGAAPSEMAGWGYGDLIGKVPAGADWIVADALGVEPIDRQAWDLVQHDLRAWLATPSGIATGDHAAIAGLFTGLVATGLAMEAYGSSRPASGADHQIAHLLEMEHAAVSHGAGVALGAVAVTALYEWLFDRDLAAIDPARLAHAHPSPDDVAGTVRQLFGDNQVAERSIAETLAKHGTAEERATRVGNFLAAWPTLRPRLADQLLSSAELTAHLSAAGVAVDPVQRGISHEFFRQTVLKARYIRRRYTVLDLLADLDLLQPALAALDARAPAQAVS